MNIIIILLSFFPIINSLKQPYIYHPSLKQPYIYHPKYDICVVGASSSLGREIIYQAAMLKNKTVLGLSSSSSELKMPYRPFNDIDKSDTIETQNLKLDNYWSSIHDKYENLIFCTGSKPFENDYSDRITSKMLQSLPETCKSISLVSAYGVGSSLSDANFGIRTMNNFYLKDVYRAKNKQEIIIKEYTQKKVIKFMYRPRGLSYLKIPFSNLTPRKELASEILYNLGYI
tara:strand:- start:2146 stop:2835 length:690 start_codon:yes stop_codon:yes gene_type:complete